MKKLLFLAALLFVAAVSQAQAQATTTQRTGTVNGQILDMSSLNVMDGAFIELRSVSDTTFVRRGQSLPTGKFSIPNMPYGDYTITVSFLGYEEYATKLTVNTRNLNIAPFYMVTKSFMTGDVEVVAPRIRVSMHGDTTIYNPAAYDVADDASAEAVLRQLPGVEVKDGSVTVNGEQVQQILVDNKETYGTDVQEVMKTIPANMLESIEVYKKLSDFAETTGINDGNDYTVMNFKTGIKFGMYGDASAMWGWEEMYAVGANFNMVTGNHRFGLNGGVNNTGALQSFRDMTTPGMFGGTSAGGYDGGGSGSKTKNIASGLTYNYEPSENFRVNANYRYGRAENESRSTTDVRYYSNPLYDRLFSSSTGDSDQNMHVFGASTRWKINNRNNVNARVSGQMSDNSSSSSGEQQYFEEALVEAIRELTSNGNSSNESFNASGQVNYGLKIGDRGRNFAVGFGGRISNTDGNSRFNNHEISRLTDPATDREIRNRSDNDYNSHNFDWKAEYFEPMSPYLHALIGVSGQYSFRDNSRTSDRLDDEDDLWKPWVEGSGVMNERNYTHRIAPGLIYKKNNNELQVRAGYVHIDLNGESILPTTWKDKRSFDGLYANINYEKQITPQKRYNFRLGTNSDTPDLEELQGIDYIYSDGFTVTGGNPGLKTYNIYSARIGFNSYNLRTSSSFSAWVNGNVKPTSTGTRRYIVDTEEGWTTPNGTPLTLGQEYSRPENIDRATWDASGGVSYGRPLKFIKSNFNTYLGGYYQERPGFVNNESNTSKIHSYFINFGLYSNFSEKMNFQLNYEFSPKFTGNSNKAFGKERGLTQFAGLDFYWLTWKNFVLRAELNYNYTHMKRAGRADEYHDETTMANVAIGKKMFKGNRGELTFAINDLFDQTTTTNTSYGMDRVTYYSNRGLGRYYSLSFRYQLRNFQK